MSTPDTIQETALVFAREVLGWEYPVAEADGFMFITFPDQTLSSESFSYSDLNAVLAATRAWCHSAGKTLFLNIVFDKHGAKQACVVSIYDKPEDPIAHVAADDLCEALMAACVAARRKMGSG